MMLRSGIRTARIEAQPRELGALEIALRMEGDGVDIDVVASSGELRDLLQDHAPRLRALLDESGVDVSDFNIGAEGQDAQEQMGSSDAHDQPQQPADRDVEQQDSRPQHYAVASDRLVDLYV